MDVTTMRSIVSLKAKLAHDNPSLTFTKATDFSWHPDTNTITYTTGGSHDPALLLHETAHALLRHSDYSRDIELLRMEREAWNYATDTLAPLYEIVIDDSLVEDSLDTYREWLHKRSLCPDCNLNGIQASRFDYRCLHCHKRWRVNEARTCRLRRTKAQK